MITHAVLCHWLKISHPSLLPAVLRVPERAGDAGAAAPAQLRASIPGPPGGGAGGVLLLLLPLLLQGLPVGQLGS